MSLIGPVLYKLVGGDFMSAGIAGVCLILPSGPPLISEVRCLCFSVDRRFVHRSYARHELLTR